MSEEQNKSFIFYSETQPNLGSIYRRLFVPFVLKHQRPLTMYVARHSLGHDSEATTQIYLASLETSVVDKANKMILGLL